MQRYSPTATHSDAGSDSSGSRPQLRDPDFVNRPHLTEAASRQSVYATGDYQTASPSRQSNRSAAFHQQHSRRTSSDSNDGLLDDNRRFSTPPQSRSASPSFTPSPDRIRFSADDAERSVLPSGAATAAAAASAADSNAAKRQSGVRFNEQTIRRKPVSGSSSMYSAPRLSQISYDAASPPTPGVDDSPYIQFAIDQLTRDEEVRARSRAYPAAPSSQVNPVGQATIGEEPEPTVRSVEDPTQTTRERSTAGPAVATAAAVGIPAVAAAGLAANRSGPQQQQPRGISAPEPAYQRPEPVWTYFDDRDSDEPEPLSAQSPLPPRGIETTGPQITATDFARTPRQQTTLIPRNESASRLAPLQIEPAQHQQMARGQPDVFVPFEQGGSPLKFLPSILRPFWMFIYLVLLGLMLAGLLFSGIWSGTREGFWGYTQFGGGRYFVFQYLPTMAGTFLLMWLFQIQIAVRRVSPFIAMSSPSAKSRTEGPLLEYMPTQFLYPDTQYFRARQIITGVCMFIFWLQIFTLPLLSALYNVFFYGAADTGDWRWNANQPINWVLFGLYLLQAMAIVVLTIWINLQTTGLKWDPRSLADVIGLLDRSNIMSDYAGSETWQTAKLFRSRLCDRSDRLGYWQTSKRPNDSFYGIGEEGGATRRYTLEAGMIREKGPTERSSFPDTPATAETPLVDLESNETFASIRYRYLPWYIRPWTLLLWSLLAIVLYLAFLLASFINRAVVRGFTPLTPVQPTPSGYSATNLTYSLVPSIIATALFVSWLSIDYAFRRLEPYATMSSAPIYGASASRSLFLDYPFLLPVSITFSSLRRKHIRVLWFSGTTLLAATLPTLAGGCFWAQFYIPEQQVRVFAHPPAFYALCVFLALLAFSLPLAFIGLHHLRLPHAATTLAEQISWLYQSRVLGERDFANPLASKPDVRTRLASALTDREKAGPGRASFVFARFLGRDGRTHLGIERLGRADPPRDAPSTVYHTPEPPRSTSAMQAPQQQQPPISEKPTVADALAPHPVAGPSRGGYTYLPAQETPRQRPAAGSAQSSSRSGWLRTPAVGTPFGESMASEARGRGFLGAARSKEEMRMRSKEEMRALKEDESERLVGGPTAAVQQHEREREEDDGDLASIDVPERWSTPTTGLEGDEERRGMLR